MSHLASTDRTFHLPSNSATRNVHHLASSLASYPAPPHAFQLASFDAIPLMALPPASHLASVPVPLAQRAKNTRNCTSRRHATADPSLRSVDGRSHKRRGTGSPHHARPVQGLTSGVSAAQILTAAEHSLSVLRTDASRPHGLGLPRSRNPSSCCFDAGD